MEENNRMGKTRDFFKKIEDIKGIVHWKMGTRKERNGKDLTEAGEIKVARIHRIHRKTIQKKILMT